MRWFTCVALGLLALAGCKSKVTEQGVLVVVANPSVVTGIVDLQVTLTSQVDGGGSAVVPGGGVHVPPRVTYPTSFSIALPGVGVGTSVAITVNALNASQVVVASGAAEAPPIVANSFVTVTVTLASVSPPPVCDGGCSGGDGGGDHPGADARAADGREGDVPIVVSDGGTGDGGPGHDGGRLDDGGAGGSGAGGGVITGAGGAGGAGGVILGKGGAGGGGAPDGGAAGGAAGGAPGAGGVGGSGGIAGLGGSSANGCSPACTADQECIAGSCVPAGGLSCTLSADCPTGYTCCDGSSESCDGVRVPTGDGAGTGELKVSADGLTVTDSTTGLTWQRGVSGSGTGCSGNSAVIIVGAACSQSDAATYCSQLSLGGVGAGGWRLPGVMELSTIVDFTADDPAINPTAFPSTPADEFWTSTPYAGVTVGEGWSVSFATGRASASAVAATGATIFRARCVSGERCYPSARFVLQADGSVKDTLTNLVWQGKASAATMTWAAATTHCAAAGTAATNFRVPSVKELLSIVAFTVGAPGPTIDPAFAGTPAAGFWTATADVSPSTCPATSSSGDAWSVSFADGSSGAECADTTHYVRCVR
jgi:hypothetical protein